MECSTTKDASRAAVASSLLQTTAALFEANAIAAFLIVITSMTGGDEKSSDWRQKTWNAIIGHVITATAASPEMMQLKRSIILDNKAPPSPTCIRDASAAFPTDARIRQKAKHDLLKEQGLKPTKKLKTVEAGNDDCGDDLSGLGPDITLFGIDTYDSDISSDDENMFLQIPCTIADGTTNIYSAVAELCYGHNQSVDLLELCGGEGRTSQVAFRRGLSSGGNVDLTTGCDLGDPQVQKAVKHYLETCNVLVVFLQPNCRTVVTLCVNQFRHEPRVMAQAP